MTYNFNEKLIQGFIIGAITSWVFSIAKLNRFSKIQKVILYITALFLPLSLILALVFYLINRSDFMKSEQEINNDISIKNALALKKLLEKGLLNNYEYNEKNKQIQSRINEINIKYSEDYRNLKNLFDSNLITNLEFDEKVKLLKSNSLIDSDLLDFESNFQNNYFEEDSLKVQQNNINFIEQRGFMNKNVFNLPNLLTSLNLASGSCALIAVIISEQYVGYFIAFSLLMDFLDGLVARALKIQSNIGKDLDSLADVVSFGLVPAFMYIVILQNTIDDFQTNSLAFLKLIPALLIVVFSALRLAKFNNEVRDSKYFYGLNTPTNAIFTYGIFAFMSHLSIEPQALQAYYYGFVGLIVVQCLLLLSDFKMFSNKSISKELKYIVSFAIIIGAAIGSYFLVGILALSVGVFAYVLSSIVVLNWIGKKIKA